MSVSARFPVWLHLTASASLIVAAACAALIAADVLRRPQKMWIMNLVWPLTGLFGSVLWLAVYLRWGRAVPAARNEASPPLAIAVFKGASHCGAGCVLGDLVAEWLAFFVPSIALWFGWHGIFAEKMFAVWMLDFVLAFGFGILFQYHSIAPMRGLGMRAGILAAIKADTASITAWQAGMYGAMAAIQLGWFRPAFGGIASVDSPEFWFAMQLAMLAGFLTGYPVNWLLIRWGFKERM